MKIWIIKLLLVPFISVYYTALQHRLSDPIGFASLDIDLDIDCINRYLDWTVIVLFASSIKHRISLGLSLLLGFDLRFLGLGLECPHKPQNASLEKEIWSVVRNQSYQPWFVLRKQRWFHLFMLLLHRQCLFHIYLWPLPSKFSIRLYFAPNWS